MFTKLYYLITLILFISISHMSAQTPYYQIDGNKCDASGGSTEWGSGMITDPPGDSDAAGSDLVNYWYDFDPVSNNFCFAFERFTSQTNGPTSTYVIYFDLDCDANTGYDGFGQGGEVAIGLEWKVNGPWEVIKFTYGSNGTEVLGTAQVGQSVCGDPATHGRFAEWCFNLDDILVDGYDPCACNAITTPGVVTLAGGNITSQVKDYLEGLSVDTQIEVNAPPVADGDVSPLKVCLGDPIYYDGSSSFDTLPDNDVMTHTWDFDYNGVNVNDDSNTESGNYTYGSTGTYTVLYQVEDTYGCIDTNIFNVEIVDAPTADIDLSYDECSFAVIYNGTGSTDLNAPDNLMYEWDFGDGNTSTDAVGTANYTACGTYDITLTVIDPDALVGCNVSTVTETITFDSEPPTITCPDITVSNCAVDSVPVYTTIAEFEADGGTISDNCAISGISIVSDLFDNNDCGGSLLRVYQITDFCGNTATCEQSISIDDNLPPTMTCPPTPQAMCDITETPPYNSYADFINAGGVITDNCEIDEASFSLVSDDSDFGSCPETFTRVYSIADVCGNEITCTQTVLVQDTIRPIINAPASASAICDASETDIYYSLEDFLAAGGSFSDNCALDSSSYDFVNEISDGNTCPETVTRYYEIADLCGNVSTATHTIIVDDNFFPSISFNNLYVTDCNLNQIPAFTTLAEFESAGGVVNDNCQIDPTSFVLLSTNTDTLQCPETFTRRYAISDMCGNQSFVDQLIIVDDQQDPTLNCPSDLSTECSISAHPPYTSFSAFQAAGGSASDNCGVIESTFTLVTEISDNNTCPEVVTRTYSIMDSCNNVATCEQIITINDVTPPVINCPAQVTSECTIADVPAYTTYSAFQAAGGNANDNCSINESTFILFNETTDGNTCPETFTRTYYIEDLCGNSATCEQIIIINDVTPPVFTDPGDLTAICNISEIPAYSDFSDFVSQGGNATDNCGIIASTFDMVSETSNGNTCPEIITRVYEIEDACGNVSTFNQLITVDDQISPIITCPGDLTAVCDIAEQPEYNTLVEFEAAGGTVSDNCGIDIASFALDSELSDGNTCPETITRIYSIADNCGNVSTCIQLIVIDDDIVPTMSAPVDLSAICDVNEHTPYTNVTEFEAAGGTMADNCAIEPSSFTLQSETSDGNTCPETVTRIYYVEDLCGNGVTSQQQIVINDAILPTMGNPSDLTAVCDITEVPPYSDFSSFEADGGSASDNCDIDPSSFTLQSETSDGNTCPEVVTRIYYIEDLCGNGATSEQIITIDDDIEPVLPEPMDLTAVCDISELPPYTDLAGYESDNGSATDNCGINTSSFVLQSETSDGNTCPETVTRIYYVEDLCGNGVTVDQEIIVNDTEAPLFTDPGDLTGICSMSEFPAYADYNDYIANGGSASDNCTLLESSFALQSETNNGSTCPEIVTRIYEIQDQCGNMTTFEQVITINDDIAPIITCPGDLTAVCDITEQPAFTDLASFELAGGMVSDNCGVDLTTFSLDSETSDGNTCPETVTRIYSIADNCGNVSTCEQLIVINDDIQPTMTNPTDLVAICDVSEHAPYSSVTEFEAAGGTMADNCAIEPSSFTLQSETSDGNTCPETVTRIYYVEDLCGNGVTSQQQIVINDAILPTMGNPSDLTAVCDITEVPPYSDFSSFEADGGSASDNCDIDPSSFTLQSETSDGNTCPEVVTRIYYIEDLCGNGATSEQIITIDDDIEPVLPEPMDLTAVCDISELPPYTDLAGYESDNGSATDNCGINTSSFVLQSETSDGNTCPETVTRIYYVEDLCGNGVTVDQEIIVNDTEAPLFTDPGDLTGICSMSEFPAYADYNDYIANGGSASDNCTLLESSFALQSETNNGSTCPEIVTRIYEIQDQCGNMTTFEQVITINDDIAPIITCPGDLTAVCDITEQPAFTDLASFELAGGTVSDNCGVDLTTFSLDSETSDGNTCPETVTRIYSIADNCGNVSTCEQLIVINDDIQPTMTNPMDLAAICDLSEHPPYTSTTEFEAAGGTMADNCAIEPSSFTLQSETSDGNTCPETVTRIYYVEDLCGNGVTSEQIVTLNDEILPTMVKADDLTAVCDISEQAPYTTLSEFEAANGSASDNCAIEPLSFALQSETSDGNTCPEVVTRIYYIEDLCGNAATSEQIITIDDDIEPVLPEPMDLTALCDISEIPPYSDLAGYESDNGAATDNCGINAASFVLQSETSDGNTCPETITRIYYVEDLCGNGVTVDQEIIVNDTEAPIFTDPGDLTGNCLISEYPVYTDFNDYIANGGSASDNCTLVESSFALQSETNNGSTCPEIVTRIYEIQDQCGNMSTFEQIVTINDEIAPEITCPGELMAVCDITEQPAYSDLASFESAGGIVSDNCGVDILSFTLDSEVSDGNTCPETITRIYSIADNCGNISTCAQEVLINDEEDPLMTAPGDLTAICDISEQPAYTSLSEFEAAGGSASDNCEIEPSSFSLQSEISDGNTCPETITRTYYVEDLCGNGVTSTQQVVLNDEELPVMTCPGDLTAICDISEQPAYTSLSEFEAAGGSASDNCEIDPNTFMLQNEVSDGNTCPETIIRTYYVEDLCGNPVTCSQEIVINDEELPVLTCPGDLIAVCSISEQAPYNDYNEFISAGGTASDNCEINEMSFILQSEVSDGNTCPETVTRIYYVEDLCGNGTTCEQIIEVNDLEAPMLNNPGDLQGLCAIDEFPVYTTFNEFVSAGGVGSDNCTLLEDSFTLQSETSDGSTCPETIIRIYEIQDQCGNIGTFEQEIEINDQIDPIISCPNELTAVCDASEAPIYTDISSFEAAGGTVSDNCELNPASFTLQSEVSDGNTCPETVIRTYFVEDLCGNGATCAQEVIVNDEILPEIICPEELTATCDISEVPPYTDYSEFVAAGGSASDNCDIDPTTFALQSQVSDGNTCPETITRTYYIEDLCGNPVTCTQAVIINDEELPTMACPSDLTAVCSADEQPPYTDYFAFTADGGSASDNCDIDEDSFILLEEMSDGNTCPETISRIYQISDLCGNLATCEQILVVNDTEAPAFDPVPDVSFNCSIDEYPPFTTLDDYLGEGYSVSDNCGIDEASFTLLSETSDGNTCPITYTRVYEITDLCGNPTTIEQSILIQDVIPPDFIAPDPDEFSCLEMSNPPFTSLSEFINAGGFADDNCELLESTFELIEENNDFLVCPRTLTRTYLIFDACGNSSTVEHLTLMHDMIPPEMSCPEDLFTNCDISEIPPFETYQEFEAAGGFASDNCELNYFSFTLANQFSDGNTCPEKVTRVYEIVDLCGNKATCEMDVYINDEIIPEMTCPGDLSAICSSSEHPVYQSLNEFLSAGGTVFDNCEIDEFTFALAEETSDGNTCPEVITRIYEIADLCGNKTSCSQQITVNDEINPVFSPATDLNFSCSIDEVPPFTTINEYKQGGGNITDNCALDQSSFEMINEVSNGNTCPEIITRTYIVSDLCGNTATIAHMITINDEFDPIIQCPGPSNASCDISEVPAFTNLLDFTNAGGYTFDNCEIDENSFALVSEVSDGNTCPEIVTRTYKIADLCGNEATCQQIITVNDIEPPVFTGPNVLTGQCSLDEVPPYNSIEDFLADGGTLTDNCGIDETSFELIDESINDDSCPLLVSRSYIILDLCGNASIYSQGIVIDDTTPPVVNCPSTEYGVCSPDEIAIFGSLAEFEAAGGTVEENCEIVPESFQFNGDETITNGCPQVINRIYSIEDVCGNIGTCSQEIIIQDTIAPVLISPTNRYGDCDLSEEPAYMSLDEFLADGGGASDNCGLNPASFALLEENTNNTTCPQVTTRIYVVSDLCGNTATSEHKITINDETPPTITCPPSISDICSIDDYSAASTYNEFVLAGGSASDNCGIVESSFTLLSEIISENSCPTLISRVYQIEDNCGNTSTCSQNIEINDTEAPQIISCPQDITLQCNPETNPTSIEQWLAGFEATDNCGIDTIFNNYTDPLGPCEGTGETTVDFWVSDNCNNIVTCSATLTIIDTLPPLADDLVDVIIDSLINIPPIDITIVTGVSDICDAFPTIIWLSDEYETNTSCSGDNLTITRTYQVIDCSGNTTNVTQTILMEDDPMLIEFTKENIICKGDATGTIDISVSGGSPDYSYDWNNDNYDGQTSLENLIAGTYSVTVTDDNNCTKAKSITITEPSEQLQVNIAPQNPVLCDGQEIELIANIQFGSTPYEYEWEFNDKVYNSTTIMASEEGVYNITIIDANGCSASDQIDLQLLEGISIDPIGPLDGCESVELVEITGVNLSGNEAYYTQPGGNGTAFFAGDEITSTTTLYVYDETGSTPNCFDEVAVEIILNAGAVIDNPGDQLVCEFYELPEITGMNLTSDVAYYTQPNGQGSALVAGDIISENTTVYIFDPGVNCSTEVSFSISIIIKPEIDPINDIVVCDSYILPEITGQNLTGNQAYYTGPGGAGTKFNAGDEMISSIELYLFDGGASCNDEEFVSIEINKTPQLDPIDDVLVCNYYVLQNITGSNLTDDVAYFTETSGAGQTYNEGDTIFSDITLYVFDQNVACSDEISFPISIVETPDIDPLNDVSTCDFYELPEISGTNLTGNEAYYNAPNGLGNQFEPGHIFTTNQTIYIYDEAGSCIDQESFTITVGGAPEIDPLDPITSCGIAILPEITGENLGNNAAFFTEPDGSGIQYSEGDTITENITLFVYIQAGSCSDEETIDVTVLASPIIDNPGDFQSCNEVILPVITGDDLTGNEAYFTEAGGNGTQYNAGDVISTSMPLFIYDANTICDYEVMINVIINIAPELDPVDDVEACDTYTLPAINGNNINIPKYYTEPAAGGDIMLPGDVINTSMTLYIYDDNLGCSDEEEFNINILTTPNVFDPQNIEACDSYVLPVINGENLTGDEGYFTGTSGSGDTYAPGDEISESITLYLYDSNNNCFDEEDFVINVQASPELVEHDSVLTCDSYTLPEIQGVNLSGNEAYYQFQNGQGASYQAGDIISTSQNIFIYDEINGCSDETSFFIEIINTPDIDIIDDETVCALFIFPEITGDNITDNAAYYTESNGMGTKYEIGDTIYNSISVYIFDENQICSDEEPFNIEILDGPNVSDIPDVEVCVSYTLPEIDGVNLTNNAGYFSGTNGSGTQYAVGEEISTNSTIYIYDAVASCFDEEVFEITILGIIDIDEPADVTACEQYVLPNITGTNLSGNESYFTDSQGNGTALNPGDTISTSTTIYLYDVLADCNDEESFDITILSTPLLEDVDDVIVCDFYELPEINGEFLVNPIYSSGSGGNGTVFEVGDIIDSEMTIYIYDVNGDCSDQTSFDVNFSPAPELNPINDITECDYVILPNITGLNLTGNQAYFDESLGEGNSWLPGDTIYESISLFAYDIAGSCDDEISFNITILPTPEIDPIDNVVVCDFYILPEVTGSNIETYVYSSLPFGNGDVYQVGDQISSASSIYVYAENGECSATEEFEVIFSGVPEIDPLAAQEVCDYFILPEIDGSNLTGSEAYFTESNGQGTEYSEGDTIFNSTTLFMFDVAGGCSDEETVEITINNTPELLDIVDQDVCDFYELPTIEGNNLINPMYFDQPNGAGNSYAVGDQITTPSTIYVYDNNGVCSVETSFEVTFSPVPELAPISELVLCDFIILPEIIGGNLTGNQAYFTESAGQGQKYSIGDTIFNSIDLYAYDNVGTCFDEVLAEFTVLPTPAIDPLDDVVVCDFYILPELVGENIDTYTYIIDGTEYFAGDQINSDATVEVEATNGICSDALSFEITFSGIPELNPIDNEEECDYFVLEIITGTNLTGNQAYFTEPNGQGTSYNVGDTITESISLYAYDVAGGCNDEVSFDIVINLTPELVQPSDVEVCDYFTLPVIQGENLNNPGYFTGTNGQGSSYSVGDQIDFETTIFIYDENNGCSDETTFEITTGSQPTATISGDEEICADEGVMAELSINVIGAFPVSLDVYRDGEFIETISVSTSPFIYENNIEGEYTIENLVTSDDCEGLTDGTATISTISSIILGETIVECAVDGMSFTVSFTIEGGIPETYSVNGNLVNTGGVTPFVYSETFSVGSGDFSFEVQDENACNIETVAGEEPNCECETQVGELTGDLEFCDTDEDIIMNYDDTNEVLESDDVRIFVLHDGSASSIGNILDTNDTPEFEFDDDEMDLNTTYFISALVGNAGNPIDFNDPCLGISSASVIYYSNPSASINGDFEDCLNSTIQIPVTLEGEGPWDLTYTINNSEITETGILSSPFIIEIVLTESTEIILTNLEGAICSGDVSGTVNLDILDELFADVIPESEICNLAIKGSEVDFSDFITDGSTNGVWVDVDVSGATGDFPILDFDGVTPGIYTFEYTIGVGSSCGEETYTLELEVLECVCPVIAVEAPEAICVGTTINLDDHVFGEPGNWELVGNTNPDFEINNNELSTSGVDGGTLELHFTLETIDPDCPFDTTVFVQIDGTVTAGEDMNLEWCVGDNDMINLNDQLIGATTGGNWIVPTEIQNAYNATTQTLDASQVAADIYTITYEVNSTLGLCGADEALLILTVNEIPTIIVEPAEELDCDHMTTIIDASASSSSNGLKYKWSTINGNISGYDTLPAITVNAPGDYVVEITDLETGCSVSEITSVLGTPDFIVADAGDDKQITCAQLFVMLDGSGSTNGDLLYQWLDGFGNPIEGANQLFYETDIDGMYILMVQNEETGCVNYDTVMVSEIINYPIAEIADTDMLTCDVTSVVIDGTASTDNDLVMFEWLDQNGQVIAENTLEIEVDQPGTYMLHVVDSTNMCESMDTITVDQNVALPQVEVSDNLVLDCITTEGTVSADIISEYTSFEWQDENGQILDNQNLEIETDQAGTFVIEVLNADNGCITSKAVIVEMDTLAVDIELTAENPCDNPFGGSITANVVNQASGVTFELSNGNTNNTGIFGNLPSGDYEMIATGANGCFEVEEINLHGSTDLNLDAGDDHYIDLGESVQLYAETSVPESDVASIYWAPEDGTLDCIECYDPTATPFYTTDYIVTLEDIFGCMIEDQITIRVDRRTKVYAPNVFTPDGDGTNDMWTLYSATNVDIINEIHVYNRWGEHVWENADIETGDESEGWNGLYKGQTVNPGVYAWYAVVTLIDGSQETLKGDVTVLK